MLGNKYTLEKLLEAEPTLKDKILSFFKGASTDYADVPKLSSAAKKYYKTYKKLFDEFSARNAENNAIEKPLTNMKQENMQDSGRQYSIVEPFTDDNGKTFKNAVLLDTTFFNGLSPRNWGSKLKGYVENRSQNDPFIMQIIDENGQTQELVFAKKSDYVKKDDGSYHKALSELYATSDNISKLTTIHVDEIIEVSEENNPYYSSENSHGWFDKNGWLHRNANVINAKTGAIYNVTIDIAKTEDGRTVLYATKGKIKKVGQAKVNSLKTRGSTPYSNFKGIISQNNSKINTSTKKSSEKSSGKQYALDIESGEQIRSDVNDQKTLERENAKLHKRNVSLEAQNEKLKGQKKKIKERYDQKKKRLAERKTALEEGYQKKAERLERQKQDHHVRMKARYETDTEFTKSSVKEALGTIEAVRRLPYDIQNEISRDLWLELEESDDQEVRNTFILKYSVQLYQAIKNATIDNHGEAYDVFDNMNTTQRSELQKQLEGAIREAVNAGRTSILADQKNIARESVKREERRRTIRLSEVYYLLEKIDDRKKQRFIEASGYKGDLFKGTIDNLTKIDWRGKFSANIARAEIKKLAEWYNEENPMLKGFETPDENSKKQ